MPRLFTGLEIPSGISEDLALVEGGLPGARWIDLADHHVTLRFIGDVDDATAREIVAALADLAPRSAFEVAIDRLGCFGGAKPRAIVAHVVPGPDLTRLQAAHESVMQDLGLAPEARRYTPHVTLARLRGTGPAEVAAYLAGRPAFDRLVFTPVRTALYSARTSVGGGPYVVEAAFPFG